MRRGPCASTVVVECGSGTYVRTLAADLGAALGGRAHLRDLRRLRVGSFYEGEAHTIEEIEADPARALLTPAAAMRDFESITVGEEEARAVAHGVVFTSSLLPGGAGSGPFAVLDGSGSLLAVYERRGPGLRPCVVLAQPGAPG